MLRENRGMLLVTNLMVVGFVSLLVTTSFSVIQHEIASVDRMTGRVQALYAAEAGLDAANDLLAQDWESYRRGTTFPLREGLSTSVNGQTVNIGEFEVLVSAIDDQTLQVTSTGRSLPRLAQAGQASPYVIARTLTMVVARKEIPRFRHLGRDDVLELEAYYFNKDGVPDLLAIAGTLAPAHGQEDEEDSGEEKARGLRSSNLGVPELGIHLIASFTDVDLDGDLDLVLCDVQSKTPHHARRLPASHRGSWQAAQSHSKKKETKLSLMTMTGGEILGKGRMSGVVTHGWLWLPEGAFTGSEPGTEVFFNTPVYDGTLIVSWGEQ